MQASINYRRLYYQLFVSAMIMALVLTTFGNVMALFYTPIAEAMGTGRSQAALMSTFASLASILGAPVWGWWYSRAPVKKPLLCGLTIVTAVLYSMGVARTMNQLYFLASIIGFVFAGTAMMPVTLMITQAAPAHQRALMLSIAFAGSGLGGMILNPLVNTLIHTYGYSQAFIFMSFLIGGTLLPLIVFLPKQSNGSNTKEKRDNPLKGPVPVLGTRVKLEYKPLVLLSLACFFAAFAFMGTLLNFPSYLQLCGYDAAKVSLFTSLGSGSLMFGKIGLGAMYDRLGPKRATMFASLTAILAIICLLFLPSTIALGGYIIFSGLGLAIGTVTPSYLASTFFPENRSQAMGYLQVTMGLGGAAGVPALAKLMEMIPHFQLSWLLTLGFTILMLYLFLKSIRAFSKRPPEPAKIV